MNEWSNLIILGDCRDAMDRFRDLLQHQIRLVYIDPPFFSGSNYTLKQKIQGDHLHAGILNEVPTYSDRWSGGLGEYLAFMRSTAEGLHSLLRHDGTLWVHLDWHVSHYVKVMLDDVFGYNNFLNEIVWKRTNSPKAQSHALGSQHDVILVYAVDASQCRLSPIYRLHDAKSLRPYSYSDERGRFRLIEIEAQGIQRSEERTQFKWHGRTAPYLYTRETLDAWWEQGLIYRSKNGRYSKKQYLSEVPGVPVSDLWLDIPPVQGSSAEYTGFLTQKPISLLQRIIECATDSNDIVADFFVGSGTTAAASLETARRWFVCDISPVAIDITLKRLRSSQNWREDMCRVVDLLQSRSDVGSAYSSKESIS